ncbi:MAG: hypothetical protein FJ029_02605 [Actinobacteria bacterium]|nr:hypothetical protein [Actinomycetota bacterium]
MMFKMASGQTAPRRFLLLAGASAAIALLAVACGGGESQPAEKVTAETGQFFGFGGSATPAVTVLATPTLSADGLRHVEGLGTVLFLKEQGLYLVRGDDGFFYEPTELKGEFRTDGLRVVFEGIIKDDAKAKTPDGKVLELRSMSKRD